MLSFLLRVFVPSRSLGLVQWSAACFDDMMNRMSGSLKIMGLSIFGCAMFALSVHADPAATQPSTMPADEMDVKEVRQQLLEWDNAMPKMSLKEVRRIIYTEGEREATYADWVAHESWEGNKTEQSVRDKWGPEADEKFARITSASTREDDSICHVVVDGNAATVSWDIKEMTPERLIMPSSMAG